MNKNKSKLTAIIGNGFDINLGLNTSYDTFIRNSITPNLINYCGEFKLLDFVSENHKMKNWIDLEIQLKEWFGKLHKYESRAAAQNDFRMLVKLLKQFIDKKNKEFLIDEKVKKTNAYKLIKEITYTDYTILNFNYTDTVKKILLHFGFDESDINKRMIHVHGNVSNQIILGVEDSAPLDKNVTFIKKSGQLDSCPINFNSALKESNTAVFFGHSLGQSDYTYFENFFRENPNQSLDKQSTVLLNYFEEDGWNDLYANLDQLTNLCYLKFSQNYNVRRYDVSKEVQYEFN